MTRINSSGSSTGRIVLGVVVVGAVAAIAILAYIWVSGGSGEASQAITAPTLALTATTPPTTAPTLETQPTAVAAASDATTSPTEPPPATLVAEAALGAQVFNIVSEESEVRFKIYEELRGQPTTVIGRTNQVAGQILVNFDDPSASQVGVIRVNVRTLATDNEFRNRAIRGQILQSAQAQFEFSEFTPTALEGMPESVTIGEAIVFKILGNLQLRHLTNPVTFDVTVTPESEDRLVGLATAVVQRTPFELTIPNAPGVANVGEDVTLEIDFVATAAS